jgi:hypothetical protein
VTLSALQFIAIVELGLTARMAATCRPDSSAGCSDEDSSEQLADGLTRHRAHEAR